MKKADQALMQGPMIRAVMSPAPPRATILRSQIEREETLPARGSSAMSAWAGSFEAGTVGTDGPPSAVPQ